ncbi:hypothetical protein GON26_01215 [Flavobacterium sp. GA093]|uniref:Uncharacterized protein n=1 Tax=Flavobacterium hydrocarbonoxydans TaxID=2683249 RepID=A0A6I4NMU5_9FLAO|nr:hypothetical protein [Flavobacterium hydrocarbonoxydans]MWB92969.1 hypothetical protein [Flavobacterium hydrocarbonoxydans]
MKNISKKDANRSARLYWFLMGFLLASSHYLLSCKATLLNNFMVTDSKNCNYYTDSYTIVNDSIYFSQRKRNKTEQTFVFPVKNIKIVDKERKTVKIKESNLIPLKYE